MDPSPGTESLLQVVPSGASLLGWAVAAFGKHYRLLLPWQVNMPCHQFYHALLIFPVYFFQMDSEGDTLQCQSITVKKKKKKKPFLVHYVNE